MSRQTREKLHSRRGIARLVVLVGLLVLALAIVLVAVPAIRAYKAHLDAEECGLASAKVQEALELSAITSGGKLGEDEAERTLRQSMWDLDASCPAGGDFCLERDDGQQSGLRVVCGLHETDAKRRVRVNAKNALAQLQSELSLARQTNAAVPDSVALLLNGTTLTAQRVTEEPALKRGTFSTSGYEGTVAFYLADGSGATYFVYADPDRCAIWRPGRGWDGDAWS